MSRRSSLLFVLVALLVVWAGSASAVSWTSQWSNLGASIATSAQMSSSIHGNSAQGVADAQCAGLAGCHHVTVNTSGTDGFGQYVSFNQYNSAGGGIVNQWSVRLFFQCTVVSTNWVPSASGSCTPPPAPCELTAAGSSASGTGFFDMGTNPDKAGVGGAGNVTCSVDGGQGCLAVFEGVYPVGVALESGVAHYFGQGSYKYVGGAATACTSSDVGEPAAIPPSTCPSGQVLTSEVTPTGSTKESCVNSTNGNENNPNDQNNDGKPDSCQPGSFTTADGWAVTVTWNAATSTCTQHGEKAGNTNIDWSGSPTTVPPFTDPHPPGGGPTTPTDNPVQDFCKKNPESALCKKSATGGSCSTFTCSGDAATCAIASATQNIKCAFDNTKTIADAITDAGLSGSSKSAFLTSVGTTTTDVSTILQTNTRDLSGSCPAPISIATPWRTVSVSFSPLCDLAAIIGVMVMLAATFVSVRLLAGGAG